MWEGLNIGKLFIWLFKKAGGDKAYFKFVSAIARKENDGVTPDFHPPGGGAHP